MPPPPWSHPEQDKPAPMPLLRVQSFVNTLDLEEGKDLLLDSDSAADWLAAAGLTAPGTALRDPQLREARAMRDGLRALIRRNSTGAPLSADERSALQGPADRRRPAVSVDVSGRIELAVDDDLASGLLALLLTVRDAQADGTWARLKLCANPDCEWAFFDRSRNRQGTWCTMSVCGNRLKNRRFRARGR